MISRSLVRRIIARASSDKDPVGFWLGKPQPETVAKLNARLGTRSLEEIQQRLGDPIRWITPQYLSSTYQHPQGKSMRPWKDANPHGLSGQGLLDEDATIDDLDRIDFPDPEFLDFSECIGQLRSAGDVYRLSGMWSPFFHDLCYLFGTEGLLMLMMTDPEVVEEASRRICGFYLTANEQFFQLAGDFVDASFIGNDFGTQNALLISPAHFREHFLPWIKRFADQAHSHGLQMVLHSCGAVAEIVDDLIDAGLDCLHPLQTRAAGMAPSALAVRFHGRITFMGGVDTQDLLCNDTPADVSREVRHLISALGPHLIVGPSHEALLPNVQIDNVLQMASEVTGFQPSLKS